MKTPGHFSAAINSVAMPIAHCHPRTGETILYVCQQMTSDTVGLPKDESDELLEALFEHLYAPENVVVHDWRRG
ncbi:Taurine catabolism dioxygenase TauD, TfdA family, partial [Sphingomonas sp. YR710]|uniref:TauD/TfdA dioxygenase family protein n=1 Tax=Sphingomonas sp. YR710 TaxID=1882773 RepID=UPI000888CD39